MTWVTGKSVQPSRNGAFAAAVSGGVLAALAVFLIYWPARENGFVFDDWKVLDVDNSVGLRDPALWRETLFRSPDNFSVLFRPLTMFTFLLQLWTGPLEPQPFHIVNFVIHSATVFLLVLVSSRMLANDPRVSSGTLLAVLCGLIYGTHPALIEPVIWISARPDLLITFFLILALHLDQTLPEAGWWRIIAVGLLFLAAMLCKETAVAFLLVLPLFHLAVHWLKPRTAGQGLLARVWARHYKIYFALLIAVVAYLAARIAVSGPDLGVSGSAFSTRHISPFSQHVLVVIASLAQHVWSALWPFQDIVPFRYLTLPISSMAVLPMAAASTVIIVAALAAVITSSAGRVPAILFLAFVGSLLPVANIVLIPAVAVWDEIAVGSRYLTFPLILACLAVPFVVHLVGKSLVNYVRYGHALVWMIAGAWLLGSVANVRVTIPLWSDDVVLNTWAIHQGGASFWRYGNLGARYLQIGDYGRSREASAAALKLRDDDQTAWIWNNLGIAEDNLGNATQAMQAFRRALELGTDEIRSRTFLAYVERKTGNVQAAARILEEGLSRIPPNGRFPLQEAQLRYRLGTYYSDLGRPEEAAKQLNSALSLTRNPEQRRIIEEALQSAVSR